MDMPIELRNAVDDAALSFKQSQLKDAVKILSARYETESGQGKRLVSRDVETAAYAVVRMPATFGAVSSALEYAVNICGEEFKDMLDVGAGTGTATFAALAVLESDIKITCIEREDSMIKLGKKLAANDSTFSKAKWIQKDFTRSSIDEKADLVIASYSLNELDDNNRKRILEELWRATGKMLLIVEPGTPVGFGQIRAAGEILVKAGGYIAAPCPGNEACPITEGDWCHFTARVSRSKLHKLLKEADVPYEDEKYSFLAVMKKEVQPAAMRVLRHPVKEPGKITLSLCTKDGIMNAVVTKKDGKLFKEARKASAGDDFEFPE